MTMNDGSLTVVGGKVIEQTEAAESNYTPQDELAEAKEAAKKAMAEYAESEGKEAAKASKTGNLDPFTPPGAKKDVVRGEDGKFKPKEEPKDSSEGKNTEEDEPLDIETASVKQILKQREKVARLKKDAKDEISKERQALQAEYQRIQQQQAWFQQQAAELQRQQEALKAIKKDPARAIRELQLDPEEFILNLAQEGTPEGQARRQQTELQRQLAELKAWQDSQAKAAEEAQQKAYMQAAEQYRKSVVDKFVSSAMDEEKYPHISTFYKNKEKALVAIGDITADEFRSLTGKEGGMEQILEYLEDELAETAKNWYTKSTPSQKVTTKVDSSKAKPGKSNGKSLSPDMSGERRALSSKDIKDLDGEERMEAAKLAVKVALAAASE